LRRKEDEDPSVQLKGEERRTVLKNEARFCRDFKTEQETELDPTSRTQEVDLSTIGTKKTNKSSRQKRSSNSGQEGVKERLRV